jgi:hypothetical protein
MVSSSFNKAVAKRSGSILKDIDTFIESPDESHFVAGRDRRGGLERRTIGTERSLNYIVNNNTCHGHFVTINCSSRAVPRNFTGFH